MAVNGNAIETRLQIEKGRVNLTVQGVELDIATISRPGKLAPIVFLHGFGSTKEDYADIVHYSAFERRPILAYDAPGCGVTHCSDLSKVSIPFLVATAKALIDHFDIREFHLVGHSMGGLTALMLAHEEPNRVLSFTDIEGNVAPEDCFLSRQAIQYPADTDEEFFQDFIKRTWHTPFYSCPLYAASLPYKARAGAVRGIFRSMVELSDHDDLMTKFLSLPCPRMFMYGEQNASLSYLKHLQDNGIVLAEIPHCGHFPMYSNPVEMWKRFVQFSEMWSQ